MSVDIYFYKTTSKAKTARQASKEDNAPELTPDAYIKGADFVINYFDEYISNNGYGWLTKACISKFISVCDSVLENGTYEYANEKLPFFDDYCEDVDGYFDMVKSIKEQLEIIVDNWEDDERVYIVYAC